ncbi:MAG: threonine aldolase family protein, partial [Flavisolibacter sp.]
YEIESIQEIRRVCDDHGLSLHLDGARLFNALVAKQQAASSYGQLFHSISICLSKSLGAPVGSVLLGTAPFIKKARRVRKAFGGGMRQAGFLAAAGIYALQHHIERLTEDHEHARMIAAVLKEKDFVAEVLPVETNIIIFHLHPQMKSVDLVARLQEEQILAYAIAPHSVRLVVHLDITPEMIKKTIQVLQQMKP